MELKIDKFTPCLEDAKTGEILPTVYASVTRAELKNLKGWEFDWMHLDFDEDEIYKLTLKGDTIIQGLIAIRNFPRDRAMYVHAAESAPHNRGKNKKYGGVGGHLFAVAAKRSVEEGNQGYLFLDAKNMELVSHYEKKLGATLLGMPHPYRMEIIEPRALALLDEYYLEEEQSNE